MKTTLLTILSVTFILTAGLFPGKADAQKPKNKTEKIIIRSSGSEPMKFESLRDTIIISKDGRDTTIIRTTQEGNEKKVTVRKIINSGSDKDSLYRLEAGTEIQNESDGNRVIMHKSENGEPGTIRIEKHITRGDGTDTVVEREIRHLESEDDKAMFDEPARRKHKTITIITSDGKETETAGDETTIIYINDDSKCHDRKMKKGDSKHQKSYIIEEEKTIKKQK